MCVVCVSRQKFKELDFVRDVKFTINGSDIDSVESWLNLRHIITSDMNDANDIDRCRHMPLSSRGLSTPRRHGLACVQPLIAHLDSLLRRSKRLGYCNDNLPAVADLFSTANDEFFSRVTSNPTHVLHPYPVSYTHLTLPTIYSV